MSANVSIGELFSIKKGLLQSTKCTPGEYDFITASSEWKTHNEFDHEGEYLIFAAAASGSLGRVHYVNGKFISSDLCYILEPKNPDKYPINMHFYHFVFKSLRSVLVADTKSGTSKESINQKNFKKYKLPYFDIEQQDFWIDKLKNTLDIKNDFSNELDNQQNLLKKLRQQILQDAIEGRLTKDWREQNPDVEPASELLKRIQAEKEQLIKDKKIKKQKALQTISEDEKPFALPDGWEWIRLGDLCSKTGSGSTPSGGKSAYTTDGIKFIRSQNVYNDGFRWSGEAYIPESTHEKMKGTKLFSQDLLLNITGGSIGRCCILPLDFDGGNINQHVAIIRLILTNTGGYIHKVICSSYFQNEIVNVQTGAGREGLPKNRMDNMLIPCPSLVEIKAITTKVEKLFAICDQLAVQITSSQDNAEHLMQSVLKEAFSQESAA